MNRFQSVVGLAGWVLVSFSAALAGSFFTPGDWYRALEKPALTPPGWVFGPVWTTLYIMMGTAAWLIWKRGGFSGNLLPLSVFILQLIFNALWTWIFFGNRLIGLALVDIILLDIAVAVTLVLFWKRVPAAGMLLVPYLAWTLFATFLNFGFWRLNVPG